MRIYVSEEDMATLQAVAAERGCSVADLAEAAVSEACLAVRKQTSGGGRQAPLKLVGIDTALCEEPEPMKYRRCEGAGVDRNGSCIMCDAAQGQACRKPRVTP